MAVFERNIWLTVQEYRRGYRDHHDDHRHPQDPQEHFRDGDLPRMRRGKSSRPRTPTQTRHASANEPQQTIVSCAYPECATKGQKRTSLDVAAGTDSAKVVESEALQVSIICAEVSKVRQ